MHLIHLQFQERAGTDFADFAVVVSEIAVDPDFFDAA